jgi:hypothetical protein
MKEKIVEIGGHKFAIRELSFGQQMDIADVSNVVEYDTKTNRMVQRVKSGTVLLLTITYGVKWWDLVNDKGKALPIDEITIREKLYDHLTKEQVTQLSTEIDLLGKVDETEKKTLFQSSEGKLETTAPTSTAPLTTPTPSTTDSEKQNDSTEKATTDI